VKLGARAPEAHLVHSIRRRRLDVPLERHAAILAEQGIGVVNMHRSDWSTGLVGLFHRFDVQAFAWDAQEVRHLRELLAMDVDALYSDHVARMVATVGEFRT
jgi:glycerophosphoryl diester phosphodiesterase